MFFISKLNHAVSYTLAGSSPVKLRPSAPEFKPSGCMFFISKLNHAVSYTLAGSSPVELRPSAPEFQPTGGWCFQYHFLVLKRFKYSHNPVP